MRLSSSTLLRGLGWTSGTYALTILLRVGTTIVLARLLAPELFGLMAIINILRTGIELISDIGIGQAVVQSRQGEDPQFQNTAWTLQILRGLLLTLGLAAASQPIATFFGHQILLWIIPLAALNILATGFTSIGLSVLERGLSVARRTSFELSFELVSSGAHILFAFISPTIYALVLANILASVVRAAASFAIAPTKGHRVRVERVHVRTIFSFGKWILASSLLYFAANNFDKIYLGKVMPLAAFGVFGISRSIGELVTSLIGRVGTLVIFPLIASASNLERSTVYELFAPLRLKFAIAVALLLSAAVAVSDLCVVVVYDQRYVDAAWMLPLLLIGAWFSVLSQLGEAALVGLGKPHYGTVASGVKLVFVCFAVPTLFNEFGVIGAVIASAVADGCRYIPLLLGQRREGFAFIAQDIFTTIAFAGCICLFTAIRWAAGFGTFLERLPT